MSLLDVSLQIYILPTRRQWMGHPQYRQHCIQIYVKGTETIIVTRRDMMFKVVKINNFEWNSMWHFQVRFCLRTQFYCNNLYNGSVPKICSQLVLSNWLYKFEALLQGVLFEKCFIWTLRMGKRCNMLCSSIIYSRPDLQFESYLNHSYLHVLGWNVCCMCISNRKSFENPLRGKFQKTKKCSTFLTECYLLSKQYLYFYFV